jgi:hypothetical protein
LWQPASVVADVISLCVKLLVAAGKWQNSGRTPAAVVFSVMADVIPVLLIYYEITCAVTYITDIHTLRHTNIHIQRITHAHLNHQIIRMSTLHSLHARTKAVYEGQCTVKLCFIEC